MPRDFLTLKVNPWGLLGAVTAVGCLFTALGFFARLFWVFDLATHFRAQYALLLTISTALFLLGKKYRPALLAGIFALLNLCVVGPVYVGHGPQDVQGASHRALLINVNTANKEFERVREYIRGSAPDLVIVEEIDDKWLRELGKLRPDYTLSTARPRDDNFGIALLGKVPVQKAGITFFGETQAPAVEARFETDRPFTVIGIHLVPPGGKRLHVLRNGQLEDLARFVSQLKTPVLVLGDLNLTSWSPYFRGFLKRTGFHDSQKGRGIQGSWPVNNPILRIAIDHCLYSPGIVVTDRRIGPDIGSDHYPVVVDFTVETRPTRKADPV